MSVAQAVPVTQPAAPPMKRRRVWIVYGLLAVIVGGHLVEVVTQREHWPFSPYQMWSVPSLGWEMDRPILRGVTAEPAPREVAITPGQVYPIPYQTVVVNMQDASKAVAKGEPAKAKVIIDGLMAHYNARLAAGKNGGTKLKDLRLYTVTWKMDADATEASKKNPVRTTLVYPLLADAERASASPPVATQIVSEFGDDNDSSSE